MKYYKTKIYTYIRKLFFNYFLIPITYKITSRLTILSSIDSIKYILTHKCSVSRFGDGEFFVIMGKGNGFQEPNDKLKHLLINVLNSNITNHVIGLPLPLKDLSNLDDFPLFFWSNFTARNFWILRKYINKNKMYLNTQLSRFYIDYKDKSLCKLQLKLLKEIWDNKDIVIVEGTETRSGVGNDLFNNAKSIKRILGPARNAIDKYDEMLNAIIRSVPKENLILLSYGMTATVLAFDLAKLGYWAIDIGHLDIEYEWFLQGAKSKTAIKGKFTNEVTNGNNVTTCNDILYNKQIIIDITQHEQN
jgi:glycosyltransferase family protein